MNKASIAALISLLILAFVSCSGVEAPTPRSTLSGELLPRSEKGYELYAWHIRGEEDIWYFTLITGTNRLKTYQEIIQSPNSETEAGWVQIRVEGVESLGHVLSRLPGGANIFLMSPGWLGEVGAEADLRDAVAIPDAAVLEQLKNVCEDYGLNLEIKD